jgi:drug/metabolite transporter (DMT)-like permease
MAADHRKPSAPLPVGPSPSSPSARLRVRPSDFSMLLVCLIWGINFSMLKIGLREVPPFALTAFRYVLATVVLWLVVRWLEPGARVDRKVALQLLGLGVIGNTLYQSGFIVGLTLTTASNSSLLIAATPVVTVVIGSLLGVEQVTRAVGAAIAVGTVGVVMIVLGAHGVDFSLETLSGDLLTLFGVLCWAFFTLGVRRVGATGVSPLQVTLLTTLGGTPGLLLLGLPGIIRTDWVGLSWQAWGALLYASLLSIVVCYMLWTRSVHTIGANRTALWGLTTPIFALTTATLVLGERIRPLQMAGAAFILGSVAVNILAHWRTEPAPVPAEEGV